MPRSGASYAPLFEWHEAAHWRGYTWEQFEELSGERQSEIVAHYRVHIQLESVVAHEQAKQQRRQGRRGKRGA